jgi:hypothetical protein
MPIFMMCRAPYFYHQGGFIESSMILLLLSAMGYYIATLQIEALAICNAAELDSAN